ncbi:MAG: lactonase family protein [Acetobacteraceae bacterium]|nr:lactonase family protein [Acetobacteraceae bacterium]
MFAYVGGYTTPDRDGRGDGINVFRIEPGSGDWTHIQNVGGLQNPSLFTLRSDNRAMFSVHGARDYVTAFAIDPASGHLTQLNQLHCGGDNPVDSAVDFASRFLVVGNYASGSVAVMPLGPDGTLQPPHQVFVLDGTPGPDPKEQSSSHPHAVIFDPTGRYVVVPDKGFDRTFVFRFDPAEGRIQPTAQGSIASRPGAAPRHAAFHPRLPALYVNNELDSTVTTYRWHGQDGHLDELQVLGTRPQGQPGKNTTAEIAVSPDGRFVYVSNRGDDTIAQFSISGDNGELTFLGCTPTGGSKPRFFTLDPTGDHLYAANQDSDTITRFRIDKESGRTTTPFGEPIKIGSPSAISLIP